jgi:cytidylate kinase
MMLKSSPQQLAESLVLAGSYGLAGQKGPAREEADRPRFTIAVSRETGSGGTSVATAVGERLGWPVYDNELVERIAREMHLRASLLDSVDERRKSWLLECVEAFSSGRTVSESAFVRHLVETVLSLGAHGGCVIVGRGAAHLLPPATTVRVRLVGDLEERVLAMSRRLGVTHAESARRVEATDRERSRFIRDHFQKDPTDPRNYDLVLNTSRLTFAACAGLVIEALHHLEARAAEKGMAQLVS